MAYAMHYCPTCTTRRPTLGYHCSVCGGPVRLTNLHTRVHRQSAIRPRTEARPYSVVTANSQVSAA